MSIKSSRYRVVQFVVVLESEHDVIVSNLLDLFTTYTEMSVSIKSRSDYNITRNCSTFNKLADDFIVI